MSARIETIYLSTENLGGWNIYTAAGGFTEIPYIKPGEPFCLQVEITNISGMPIPLIIDVRVSNPRKRWHRQSIGPVADTDSVFMYFPPRVLVDGYSEEPWMKFPRGNVRVIVEAHASPGGRQERLTFLIPWGEGEIVGGNAMSNWEPMYNEEERRQRHYEQFGTYDVPERQYRRRVGQAQPNQAVTIVLVAVGGVILGYGLSRLFKG